MNSTKMTCQYLTHWQEATSTWQWWPVKKIVVVHDVYSALLYSMSDVGTERYFPPVVNPSTRSVARNPAEGVSQKTNSKVKTYSSNVITTWSAIIPSSIEFKFDFCKRKSDKYKFVISALWQKNRSGKIRVIKVSWNYELAYIFLDGKHFSQTFDAIFETCFLRHGHFIEHCCNMIKTITLSKSRQPL